MPTCWVAEQTSRGVPALSDAVEDLFADDGGYLQRIEGDPRRWIQAQWTSTGLSVEPSAESAKA